MPSAISGAGPGNLPIAIPPQSKILAGLSKSHPRLLASAEDFSRLKKQAVTEPQLQTWAKSLREQSEAIMNAAPSRYEIPDGLRLLHISRQVMNRIYSLALSYRLTGERRFAERAWKELAAAAAFKDWNPRHFLDTAEMTHAFAIGYDWLYDVWTPEERSLLRGAIVEKGLKPALAIYRENSGFAKRRNNWNQVCNGGMGMGALSIGESEPELAGEILSAALRSIQIAMSEFAPDGASPEGPGYWNYATFYNCVLLAGLDSALGTDFGLSRMTGFRDTGLYPIYLTGPLGRTFNYADGGDRMPQPPQMFWLAQKFSQPVYRWYEARVTSPGALDLLWYNSDSRSPKTAQLPLGKYFRGPELVTLRSEWEDPQALYVGFKAGDNKVSHSHLDLGSFIFDALGERWAIDTGADDYNLPAYFGNKRWTYYRLRAEGQNTLVINPGAGPDQDPAAATSIIRFQSKPNESFAIADLTAAYRKESSKVWRGIKLMDRNCVVIQDEIQAEKPAEVWWFMHTGAEIKIEDAGRSAILRQAGKELRAYVLTPNDARFETMDAQPLPSSPHPDRQAKNDGVRKLAIHLNNVKDAQLTVQLVPARENTARKADAAALQALSAWKLRE